MTVKRYDKGRKITLKRNHAGALLLEAYPSRTGIQEYLVDGKIQREFRSDAEVFDKDSLESFLGAVVTIEHPAEMVSPENAEKYSVGTVLREATPEGDHTKTLIQVLKSDAIKRIEAGELIELSVGYSADVIPEIGEYKGVKYDAVQKNIRVNHIALLAAGKARAGSTARLKLDQKDGVEICDIIIDSVKPLKKETKVMEITINGMKFEAEENLAKALQVERDQLQAKLDAAVEDAKASKEKLDSIDINALVQERVQLIEQCKKLDSEADTSLSNEELLRAVVSKSVKLDDSKSVEYVKARFDALLENIEKADSEKKKAQEAVKNLVNKADSKPTETVDIYKPVVFN